MALKELSPASINVEQEEIRQIKAVIIHFATLDKMPTLELLDREHLIAHVVTIAKNILQQYPPKTQSQAQPQSSINVDEDLNEAEIEISTMWCEVIHAISEADKKGIEVGEFIPTFLEKNYNISRKVARVNVDEAAEEIDLGKIPLLTRLQVGNDMWLVHAITELGYRENKYWTTEEDDLRNKIYSLAKDHSEYQYKEILEWQSEQMPKENVDEAAEKHGTKEWKLPHGKIWKQKLIGDKATSFKAGAEWQSQQPDQEHAKDIAALIKQIQIRDKEITELKKQSL